MSETIKAYVDLLRLHFFFVWPTVFCGGLFFGFTFYGGFSLTLILQAVLIAFFGFEAGLVLNDILDANLDKKELPVDKRLTKYWRPFGQRPLSQGLIPQRDATTLFTVLVALAIVLISTLPYPNSLYVLVLMITCYLLEVFYQLKKRNEQAPVAQVIGRIDFALFLVAGYLVVGSPDFNALVLFLFFYPLALAHLGVNDLIDVANDIAKGMNTIPTLYSMNITAYWILSFSLFHFVMAAALLYIIGSAMAIVGFAVGILLITVGNAIILGSRTAESGIKALPTFHLAMLVYAITIIANYLVYTLL